MNGRIFIVPHGKGFAKVYIVEKAASLEVLRDGDAQLWQRAYEIVFDASKLLGLPVPQLQSSQVGGTEVETLGANNQALT